MSKSNLDSNIQTNTAGQAPPCLRQKIDKAACLIEARFNERNAQSVEDRLRRAPRLKPHNAHHAPRAAHRTRMEPPAGRM